MRCLSQEESVGFTKAPTTTGSRPGAAQAGFVLRSPHLLPWKPAEIQPHGESGQPFLLLLTAFCGFWVGKCPDVATSLVMPLPAFSCLLLPSPAFSCLLLPSSSFPFLLLPSAAFSFLLLPSPAKAASLDSPSPLCALLDTPRWREKGGLEPPPQLGSTDISQEGVRSSAPPRLVRLLDQHKLPTRTSLSSCG